MARDPNFGMRYDENKPQTSLLCPDAMLGLATVLTHGATKYAPYNWAKGMPWSVTISSMLRHIFKFMAGEDIDSESGLPHVDHIMCNAMFLANYARHHTDKDDRFKRPQPTKQEK